MPEKMQPKEVPSNSKRSTVSWPILVVGVAISLPLFWVLARGLSVDPRRMDAPLVGKPAPDFALRRLSDDTIMTRDSLRGKPLVLNFWSTWCMPCRIEHPVLLEAARVLQPRVQFVGIVYQDRKANVEAWLDRYGGRDYPTLIDIGAKAAISYGVYGVPETYFIDSKGIIVDKFAGPLDFARLRRYVERLK